MGWQEHAFRLPLKTMSSGIRPAKQFIGLRAIEIARLVATGEATAEEIVEAHIRQIEHVNPQLNAVVVQLFDRARAEAKACDAARVRGEPLGPLAGVPITVKDSIDVAGAPSTYGLRRRARIRALEDSPNVARLRHAGAIVLGKTNVPQLLMANETDNPLYGRTNNPWNLERSPGGSSGGEAAILAAAGSALGLGSDSAGSLRFPANACGIAALKPTSSRLTLRGQLTGPEPSFSQPGPLARSATDLALAFRLLVAPAAENGDPTVPPVELPDPGQVALTRLRVAFYVDNGILRPAPAVRRAVEEAAQALASLGVEVEEWPPLDAAEGWDICQRILVADGLASVREPLAGEPLGPPVRGLVRLAGMPRPARALLAKWLERTGEPGLAEGVRRIRRLPIDAYRRLNRLRDEYRARFLAELARRRFDAIVCPANALPALPHAGGFLLSDGLSYSSLYNLLGLPAGVIPATRVRPDEESDRKDLRRRREQAARRAERGSAGLPVGVQVVARHWREDVVLALMIALETHFRRQADFPVEPPL